MLPLIDGHRTNIMSREFSLQTFPGLDVGGGVSLDVVADLDLIAEGWQPGPAIGEELRRQRSAAQDRSR